MSDEAAAQTWTFDATLRRYGLAGLGAAAAAAILAAGYTLTTPVEYEAIAVLQVAPSKAGDGAPVPPIPTATYLPTIVNPAVAADVVKTLSLEQAPVSVSSEDFRRDALRANPIGGTALLEVRVRLHDAELAARAANLVAERAVQASRRLNQEEAKRTSDALKAQADASRVRFEHALEALQTFRQSSQIDIVRKNVEALLDEQKRLLTVRLQYEAERARVQAADTELHDRSRTETLTRAIDSDPALLEQSRRDGEPVLGLTLKDERVDPVYEQVEQDRARSRANVAALQSQLAGVSGKRNVGAGTPVTLDEFFALERALSVLETEVEVGRTAYRTAAERYEGAMLAVASRSAELQLVTEAWPPERPLGRGVVLNAVLAFLLTVAFALSLAAARSLWPRS